MYAERTKSSSFVQAFCAQNLTQQQGFEVIGALRILGTENVVFVIRSRKYILVIASDPCPLSTLFTSSS